MLSMIPAPPLVSICCITYNHREYIRDTINGFLNQKCSFPVEILVHDDASTDGTVEILKEYDSYAYPGLSVIFQMENQYSNGIRPLLSLVLPRARGKYIALCEGDDYWTDKYKLERQVNFLENNPEFGLIASDVSVTTDEGGDRIIQLKEARPLKIGEITFFDLLESNCINTPTVCIRAEIMLSLAREAVEQRKWYAIDKWFWIMTALESRLLVTSEKTANYRWHTMGLSKADNFLKDRKPHILCDSLIKYLDSPQLSCLSARSVRIIAGTMRVIIRSKNISFRLKFVLISKMIRYPGLLFRILRVAFMK